jgi:hypothetical protein
MMATLKSHVPSVGDIANRSGKYISVPRAV